MEQLMFTIDSHYLVEQIKTEANKCYQRRDVSRATLEQHGHAAAE